MGKLEERQKIGELIRKMRVDSELTQEALAAEMDVGRNTVVAWEQGRGQLIDAIFQWGRLCDVTGRDFVQTSLQLNQPELIGQPDKNVAMEDQVAALHYYLDFIATPSIIRMLYALFMEEHGSDPTAIVNEWMANLHTPMYMRHGIAQHISSNYKVAHKLGEDPIPDVILPDIEYLDNAVLAGFHAAMNGMNGYTIEKKE